MAETSVPDLVALMQGAGTPVAGVIVFLLWKLNKEVGELKTEIKTFTEVITRYLPKPEK
jgi:hypothetical protein